MSPLRSGEGAKASSPDPLSQCAGDAPAARIQPSITTTSEGDAMPRIIVTTDTTESSQVASVLLDELVHSVHLSSGHAAAQLVERLAWSISDAEDAERVRSQLRTPAPRRPATHRPSAGGARRRIAA
jgi:hypothetical protein